MEGMEENKKEINDNGKASIDTRISDGQIEYKTCLLSMILLEDFANDEVPN